MIEMLLFWIVYGFWMVFIWGGISWLSLCISSDLVAWITQGDYNLDNYVTKLEKVTGCNDLAIFTFFLGFLFQVVYIGDYVVDKWRGVEDHPSYHSISVKVAEWVSTTLYTPLLIVLVTTGVLVLLKKGYPLFKKIKTLTDNLK